jgi:hypothetical protein
MKILKPNGATLNTLAMETAGNKSYWRNGKPLGQRVTFIIHCTSQGGETISIGEKSRANTDTTQYQISVDELEELIRQTRETRGES